jgi:hypothetical protein
MYVSATGSSHTVCQMPVVGVYQIPCGLRICFPRGCQLASIGSETETTISCSSESFFSASVTSKVNGS